MQSCTLKNLNDDENYEGYSLNKDIHLYKNILDIRIKFLLVKTSR